MKIKVKIVKVCEECNRGFMNVAEYNPLERKYRHICSGCGKIKFLEKSYPCIDWREDENPEV